MVLGIRIAVPMVIPPQTLLIPRWIGVDTSTSQVGARIDLVFPGLRACVFLSLSCVGAHV
jgi:hypothetical protein